MPELNRRRFLQVVSAAGLAPAIPALPVHAAAAPRAATTAQMLWASMYARAGSAQNAVGIARSLGVRGAAAQGVYTQLAHSSALAAQGATRLGRVAASRSAPVRMSPVRQAPNPRSSRLDFERLIAQDCDDVSDIAEDDEIEEVEANTPTQPEFSKTEVDKGSD